MFNDFVLRRLDLAVLLGIAFVAYYVVRQHRQKRLGKPLPMPRGLPIVGNLFQMGRMSWFQMTRWAKEFGPLYRLNVAGKSIIVINNYQIASDILDKKSSVFSDRPRMIMTSEILCGDSFFPFLRYGDRYRKFRKLGHEGLNPRASEQYTPFQERESRILIQDLLTDSTKWSAHISRAIASSTLALSYAVPPIKSYDDIIVTRINDFMHRVEQSARPGEYIVDIFPILNYLPESLAPFKKNGLKAFTEDSKLFSGLFKDARAREGSTCFTTLLAPKVDSGAVGENEASWLAGSMFGAGSSTTAGAQHVLILAMVLHPHVMYKAQAEIDAVVGRHRLPNAGDRDKLPYLRAITREAFRWRPIGPLGVPHYVNQDDEYQGYHLPKDSIVFFNQWAMCSDIEVYGDPENFRPERFLDETETEENLPINTHGEGHTSFGYGRRKCLGQSVANNTLMINLATMLWAFDIVKAKDANGNEITPDKDNMHDEGLVVVPAPFLCDFIPRDPEHLPEIIAQAFDAAH